MPLSSEIIIFSSSISFQWGLGSIPIAPLHAWGDPLPVFNDSIKGKRGERGEKKPYNKSQVHGLIAGQGNRAAIFLLQFIISWLFIFCFCLSVLLKERKGVFIADIFSPVMAQRNAGSFCSSCCCCCHRAVNSGTTVVCCPALMHLAAVAWGQGPTGTTSFLPQTDCLQLWSADPGRADLPGYHSVSLRASVQDQAPKFCNTTKTWLSFVYTFF